MRGEILRERVLWESVAVVSFSLAINMLSMADPTTVELVVEKESSLTARERPWLT